MSERQNGIVRDFLLDVVGDDWNREGLRETPSRVVKAWGHWASGYAYNDEAIAGIFKTFEDGSEGYDGFVIVKGIPVYSHCEHHLAPFFGTASVAYIPDKRIVGLSKMSRVVDVFARRLQVQERLTYQIAQAIQDNLKPKGVGVVMTCRHLCMESRGIERQGSSTSTSSITGCLRDEPATRAEFLQLIKD